MGFKFRGGHPLWRAPVQAVSALPASDGDGACRVVKDEDSIYQFDASTGTWVRIVGGDGFNWMSPVEDKDLADPPVSPSTGDRYIVAPGAIGAWAGQDNNITEWNGSNWVFTTAVEGMALYVKDEDEIYAFNGISWFKPYDEHTHPYPRTIRVVNSDYTVVSADEIIWVNPTTVDITITMRTAIGILGREFEIKHIGTVPARKVNVVGTSGQTFDSDVSFKLFREEVLQIISDNANWRIH